MYRVKGHRETNSSFIFIKLLTICAKISFSRIQNQICSNIMVQIKGQRATSLTFSFLRLVSIEAKISISRKGSFHFTEFKTKYVQITGFASTDVEGQVQPSYLLN